MAPSLDDLGYFYGKKMDQATGVQESFDHKVLHALLVTCTVTGFFAIALYTIQFMRLMLSLFVLPGKSVCQISILGRHVNR